MRNILKEHALERELNSNGFIIIPAYLGEEEVARLNTYYNNLPIEQASGFHVSNYNSNTALKKDVSTEIANVIGTKAQLYLNDYIPLSAFYYVKEADEAEDFYIHLDWNMVNENKFQSVAMWVPLIDINEDNGGIVLLKGSQHEPQRWRGNPGFCYPDYDTEKLKSIYDAVQPRLKAGDAVLWTHKLFHGSAKNESGNRRIAASQILIPKEAEPILINRNENGEYELYNTSVDFFAELEPGKAPPGQYIKEVYATLDDLVEQLNDN